MLTLADFAVPLLGPGIDSSRLRQVPIQNTVIDSRLVEPGHLFVALQGERLDGHDFVPHAVERGAVAILAEERALRHELALTVLRPDHPVPEPLSQEQPVAIIVPDSLAGLQQAAAHWRRRFELRVIGVTGSVGKTVTKELVAAVLRQGFKTVWSEGNYNNEIGLPLSLLRLDEGHERAVLEMGMYDLGEIAHLAEIALPTVGLVTNVGPTHLERLGSLDRIAQAKAELPQALPPARLGGVAILNADDERVRAMANQTAARIMTYGLSDDADLRATDVESAGLEGIRLRFHHAGQTVTARLPLLGRHSVHTALAAAAVGLVEGLAWGEILQGLHDRTAQIRLVTVEGPRGSLLLDDTYNSSPASCLAALNLLAELSGRRVAVLGDMLELGYDEAMGHALVGRRARDVAQVLVTVGPLGKLIGDAAAEAGMHPDRLYQLVTNAEAIDLLRQLVRADDVILVKGSRGLQMEEIVAALTQSQTGENA
jgi:UDP-N-acetylmuramoyl-tripeptide--D-alanyl-D-alanine ligase